MKKILFISVALFAIISCSETSTEAKKEAEPTRVEKIALPMVQLNDGERWEANAATIEGIENLTEMVMTFDAAEGDYDILQSKLREEFGLIFKNCTMKGEAHEQLHNYLLPLMELFGKLTLEDREDALAKIKEHLARFDTYFVGEA
ncbi:MAG TPA: hypothetical protein VJ949_10665 [Cryomorphaceae bacterium]|nr:hypothetical protein [Cryomorphaceae bacterium]